MKASIIVNCHNGENYLEECLLSIKNQSYENYEVIFYDNNSTDNSKIIYKKYENEKFKYFRCNIKKNLYDARNAALNECTGEIINFLDVDDVWHRDKLLEQIKIFKIHKDVELIYTDYILKDEYKKKSKKIFLEKINKNLTDTLLKDTKIALLTVAVRKKTLERINFKFDSDYSIIGDFDLLIKLSLVAKFYHHKFLSATYRFHSNSETNKNFIKLIDELKDWKIKNLTNRSVNSLKNFKNLDYKIDYYNTIYAIKNKKYTLFFKSLKKIKFSIYIVKIIYWIIFK